MIWDPALRTNCWFWTGGLNGVVYLTVAIWLIPLLGTAPVVALIIAGQMIAAVAFDHVGLFGLTSRPIDFSKCLGIALLVTGVVLIRR